jgi:DNA-binding transcriptional LysR family regulator
MVLTADGRRLLHYARRILALNDEAKASLRRAGVEGPVRLGTNQDLAESSLPDALARFALTYPAATLEVTVESSATIKAMLDDGALDLALTLDQPESGDDANARSLAPEPLIWIGNGHAPPSGAPTNAAPLPLVLCDERCGIRAAALAALEAARLPHRIVYVSPSLAGLRAAVRAGLGITARGERALEAGLAPVAGKPRLPALPELAVMLSRAPGAPASAAINRLAAILEGLFAEDGDPAMADI